MKMALMTLAAVLATLTSLADSAVTLRPDETEIVVAADAPKTVLFAAKEMKHFLDGVLGSDVGIVRRPTAGKRAVFLGASEWTRDAGLATDGLARDAFRIVANGKGVFIAGRDDASTDPEKAMKKTVWAQFYERGTLFGVYEFLERYVGVRLYFPGEMGEIVPRRTEVAVPALDRTFAPAMDVRRSYTYFDEGVWFEGARRDVASTGALRWLNTYRLRMETAGVPFCHGLSQRGYLSRFAGSHPEFFQLKEDGTRNLDTRDRMPGKLCFTSDVWEEIYKDSVSYLKGEPASVRGIVAPNGSTNWWYGFQGGKYVDLMPQDGMMRCTCPNCRSAYDPEPSNYMTTLIWSKTAEMARRLEAACPGCIVTQMAYQPYRRVPKVDIPGNVMVMVAERGPWSVPYAAQFKSEADEVAAWSRKLGHKVCIWNYACKYSARNIPGIPDLTPWLWGTYYKTLAPSVNGFYAESHTDRFLYKHLDFYVLGKIAWDPTLDVDAVIDEYFRLMFGAAGVEMKRVYRSLQNRWAKGVLRQGIDTVWGPSFDPAPKSVIWTEVYSPKVLEAYDRLFAQAREKTSDGSLARRRVELMQRELIEPLRAAAQPKWEHFRGLETCRYRVGSGERFALSPRKGGRPIAEPVRTDVGAVVRDGRLEIDVFCEEPHLSEAIARKSDFDFTGMNGRNMVEVIVVPGGHPADLYMLQVDSAGTAADMSYRLSQYPAKIDINWNSGGTFEASAAPGGWMCRMSVPLTAFPDLGRKFRVEVIRHRKLRGREPEDYNWSPVAARYDAWDDFGTWELEK